MKRSRKILMLLGSYDSSVHAGIARAAQELHWHLDVSLLKTFQLPQSWSGDGIITSLSRSKRLTAFVQRAKLPTLDLSVWRSDIPLPRVVADNEAIGRAAAQHYVSLGHQHCGWFALGKNTVGDLRYKGFKDSLPDGVTCVRLDAHGVQSREEIAPRIRDLPFPVGIFCRSDDEAAWLLNLCMDLEIRVPEDVAILGVDNNQLICENQPIPLSSVNHDLERVGYEGAQRLDALISGAAFAQPLLIPPQGVTTRQSTDAMAVADPEVRQALAFMKDSLGRSIGTLQIAEHAHLSRRALEKRFRAATHMTVHQKLMELRLKNACERLLYSNQSIEDISAYCGFSNAPHFSRSFKAAYLISPLQYRKTNTDS